MFEKSVASDNEFIPVINLYSREILADDAAYKFGLNPLLFLLKNYNNFMTKKN